jgi:hypothetical protein
MGAYTLYLGSEAISSTTCSVFAVTLRLLYVANFSGGPVLLSPGWRMPCQPVSLQAKAMRHTVFVRPVAHFQSPALADAQDPAWSANVFFADVPDGFY